MINASQLRIGNWVEHIGDNVAPKRFKVLSISQWGINHWLEDSIKPRIAFESIQSIPLTSEILEKCGFEKNTGDDCYYIYIDDNNVHFEFDCEHKEVWIGGFNSSSTMEHIRHLHQLQNLFFMLTGEELKVEL